MKPVKNLNKLNKEIVNLFGDAPFRFEITAPKGPAYDVAIWLIPHKPFFRNYISLSVNWKNNRIDVFVRCRNTMRSPKGFNPQLLRIDPKHFQTMQLFIEWVQIVIPAVPNLKDALMVNEDV